MYIAHSKSQMPKGRVLVSGFREGIFVSAAKIAETRIFDLMLCFSSFVFWINFFTYTNYRRKIIIHKLRTNTQRPINMILMRFIVQPLLFLVGPLNAFYIDRQKRNTK